MSLRVSDISVVIDRTTILSDVDLDVAAGEVVCVLGPSGSGKSTLLRVVAGLQAPATGAVVLDGVDVTSVPTHRRGVGLMFQDHALFPHRDVHGNVAFGLRMAGAPSGEITARVDEVLDLVGLAGYGRRAVDGLSGGERQRVALARALAPRPRLLLFDEPLGSLDRVLRDRLIDELGVVLRSSQVTALYVTHDHAEAFAIGDRVAVMRAGRLAQVGSPDEVWVRPADAGVASIVGAASLVDVEVTTDGVVQAPWGPVDAVVLPSGDVGGGPQIGGGAVLVVRADTFALVEAGAEASIPARVAGSTFRGDHRVVVAAVECPSGPPVEIEVAILGAGAPRVGHRVGLRPMRELVVVPPAP